MVERLYVVLLQVSGEIWKNVAKILIFIFRSDSEPAPTMSNLVKSIENMSVSSTSSSDNLHSNIQSMPRPIRKSILKQNVKFLHNR